ncbi:MAG TPA: hypothetical protein VGR57_11795, partial [Ktedonobacterales bacterium]|nr:hypothetical protein [Ktedonobacterales bacterium]
MCPRKLAGVRGEPTLLKCCLLEYHIEQDGATLVVPWGADLKMVEEALRKLAAAALPDTTTAPALVDE